MLENRTMFGIFRKLATLGIIAGLIWTILQLDYKGRPVKDQLREFFRAPLVQEIGRQAKNAVVGYLKKDVQESEPAMEKLEPEDQQKLKEVIEKEAGRK